MIHYHLRCERGHVFESWFQSSSAYEAQEKRKLVNCPTCGSAKVERAIMAPQIVSKKGRDRAEPAPAATPAVTEVPAPASTPLLMAQERELRAKIKESRTEEAKAVLDRAQKAVQQARNHPRASELEQRTSDLRMAVDAGDEAALDDMIDELLRLLTEIEAGA